MVDTVIVGEVEAGRSAKVRKQLESLLTNMEKSKLDVAELLFEIKSKHYYAQWGFDTFKAYTAQTGIKQSKAYYLPRMVEVMNDLGITRSQYEPLGISKLREITSLDHRGTYFDASKNQTLQMSDIIAGLVENGTKMGLDEIRDYVRQLKGLTGENELVWLNVCVKRAARDETIKPAIELAKMNIGTSARDDEGNAIEPSDGAALEAIAVEYLNDPNNKPLPPVLEV